MASGRPAATPVKGMFQQVLEHVQPPAGQETAFLGLGSNMGDRLDHLNAAVALLDAHPKIVVADISSVYETEPVGGPEQDSYYNIAVRIRTVLSPVRLLRACHGVEDTLGRVRTVRWGPRTIDVDILVYGDRSMSSRWLTVPHPRLTERLFALVPLMEVAPAWILPDGRSLTSCAVALAPMEGVEFVGRQVALPGQQRPEGHRG